MRVERCSKLRSASSRHYTEAVSQLALVGGPPTKSKPFPAWPVHDERERAALLEVLESGVWWRTPGTKVLEFERAFAEFHGARHAVAVTNGTHALEVAMTAIGVGPGDEVIVPDSTFVATAGAVLFAGALPVMVDVQPGTWCIDLELAEAAIGPRTAAIVAVHMGFTAAVLLAGNRVAQINLQTYFLHLIPLALVAFAIHITAFRCWRHPSVRGLPLWRPMVLVYATWPVYTLAWLMTLARMPLGFRSTPKKRSARSRTYLLMPQIAAATVLAIAVWFGISGPLTAHLTTLLVISLLQTCPQVVLLWQAARMAQV